MAPRSSSVRILATLLLAGTWAYTDVLAELARACSTLCRTRRVGGGTGCWVLCWVAGAQDVGTVHQLLWRVLRCLIGGVLMAWGSLLIPGSNDGLILIGMPLLWPYAWVAFLVMCLTVACHSDAGSNLSTAILT